MRFVYFFSCTSAMALKTLLSLMLTTIGILLLRVMMQTSFGLVMSEKCLPRIAERASCFIAIENLYNTRRKQESSCTINHISPP